MTFRLIIILLLFFPITSVAQTADFTYRSSNASFCTNQILTFKQACTGSPVQFNWTFGNGNKSTNDIETIKYSTTGLYKVTLTATYSDTIITVSKNITINPTPTIAFTTDTIKQCKVGDINLSTTSTGLIANYDWDFGDVSTQNTTTNSTVHTFSTFNNFRVIVTATTSFGCFTKDTMLVQLKKNTITGKATAVNSCIPATATFTASSSFLSGDFASQYLWDFGDGQPTVITNTPTTNHIYTTTDSFYNANVTITSNQGCTNQYTYAPIAFGEPTTAIIQKNLIAIDSFCASQNITFIGKALKANKYKWTFGDGAVAFTTKETILYKYNSLGLKQVILTPYFNNCEGISDTTKIFIKGVIAKYAIKNSCAAKNNFSFTNQSIPIASISSFKWLFSDDPSITDVTNFNANHTFPTSGKYLTTLIVFDNVSGCSDTLATNIYTATPNFTSTKTSVCKDSIISYSVNNTYDAASNYLYEFHVNGKIINNGTKTILNYFPKNFGTYSDTVVIKKNNFALCYDTLILPLINVTGPSVSFINAPTKCIDTAVNVVNTTTPYFASDNITKWLWNFGDNTSDSIKDPSPHLYSKSDKYTIMLTATDINGCAQKASNVITMNPLPQLDILPKTYNLCLNKNVQLVANTNVSTITWTPPQQLSCVLCTNPIVNPLQTTTYIAEAIDANGCKQFDSSTINVFLPFTLKVSPQYAWTCANQPIKLTTNLKGDITWAPTTFLKKETNGDLVSTPSSTIKYTISMKDSIGCFVDTTYATISIYPAPTVNAGADQLLPYGNNYSINPIYSNNITDYNWMPSTNLSCTTCATPSVNVLNTETYIVNVKNVYGCLAADTIIIRIVCDKNNLYVPSAFTPNNDGLNDYLYPIARGYKIVNKFLIYNRYGEEVFERTNFAPNIASFGWDGKFKGSLNQSTETYVWEIEATCLEGQIIHKNGFVVSIP